MQELRGVLDELEELRVVLEVDEIQKELRRRGKEPRDAVHIAGLPAVGDVLNEQVVEHAALLFQRQRHALRLRRRSNHKRSGLCAFYNARRLLARVVRYEQLEAFATQFVEKWRVQPLLL